MKVLLAIDGSSHSEVAVAEVARRPWPSGTTVMILTVIHPPGPPFLDPMFVTTAVYDETVEELRLAAPILLIGARTQLRNALPHLSVSTKIVEGVPKDVIVNEAEEWGADLIVMGSHGYGPVRSMVLGSVTRAVLTESPCSVLVARRNKLHQAEPTVIAAQESSA